MKKTAIKLMAAAFLLGSASALATGCNTVAGVGEDVSTMGKGITTGAEKTKRKM